MVHLMATTITDKGYLWTGQLTCHDVNGELIDCAQSGQDAEFHRGISWPLNRFEHEDKIIQDKLTGLQWLRNANHAEFPFSWQEALDFVQDMNQQQYLGFSDWRVPNRRELYSLMDLQSKNPALPKDHPFENVFQSWYWTSTTAVISPAHAWYINMEGARMFYGGKDQSYFIWPVRGKSSTTISVTGQKYCYDSKGQHISCVGSGQDGEYQFGHKWPELRFTLNCDTFYDHMTNLFWLKKANLTHVPVTWAQALFEVEQLNQKYGIKKWRLPNINELESLIDCEHANPALPHNNIFVDIQDAYWSSTTSMFEPDWAWALYLNKGAVGVGQKSGPHFYVWPVSDAD